MGERTVTEKFGSQLGNLTELLSKRLVAIVQLFALTTLFCESTVGQDRFQSLAIEIGKIVQDTKAVGVSVALIENYDVVWAKGFGIAEAGRFDSVTAQTLFQAASISKSITSLAVMKKVQEGMILLNGNVDNQLVSWHVPKII